MSLNYTSYIQQLTNLVVSESTANTALPGSSVSDPYFAIEIPGIIDYAEQRIYRDLDLLATRYVDATTTASSGIRTFTLPTDTTTYLVVEGINYFVTSTGGAPSTSTSGTRTQCIPTSRSFLDTVYGSTSMGPPEFFAMLNNTQIVLGPIPDQAYPIEIIGTGRPTPLSSGNSSTILTQMLPDLFMAASMIKASAYMRDFGSQADNPQMSGSWEATYGMLLKSAATEEFRKKGQGHAWTNQLTAPSAVPPRS
jgi:hypothetical protein